ncbi:MAG: DUF5706 domain-containing protein [Gemmatimonadales bacterium]|nr:DUF5706 domain-containing protein [Gemmatimonadales bacterium]
MGDTWDHDRYQFEHAWRIYLSLQDLLRSADAKTQMLLTLGTVFGTLALNRADHLPKTAWIDTALVAAVVGCAAGFLLNALLALFPRVKPPKAGDRRQLIFFGRAPAIDVERYVAELRDASVDDMVLDLAHEIRQLDKIVVAKFAAYQRAWFFLLAIVTLAIAIVLRSVP